MFQCAKKTICQERVDENAQKKIEKILERMQDQPKVLGQIFKLCLYKYRKPTQICEICKPLQLKFIAK